jgi:hypothetical protein
MDIKNQNNSKNKNQNQDDIEVYNDQLGENASEEYKSEEYSNAVQNKNKNKSIK